MIGKGVDFSTGYTTRGLQPCFVSFREPKVPMARVIISDLVESKKSVKHPVDVGFL